MGPPPTPRGAVAIVADDDAWADALRLRAERLGAPVIETVVPDRGDPRAAAHALDRLARRESVGAVAVALADVGDAAAFGEIARAAGPHVPICVLDGERAAGHDPWRGPWLASLGAVVCRRVDELLAAAWTLALVDPPAGPRVAVCGAGATADWLRDAIASAVGVDVETTSVPAATCLAGTEHDLVVALLDPSTDLAALAGAVAAHDEVGLVAIAPRRTPDATVARAALGVVGVPVFDGPDALVDGLSALAAWVAGIDRIGQTSAPRVADAHRLRRAVANVRDGRTRADDADVRADIIAALGQHVAPWRRIHYVEDALVASGDLGYPVALVPEGDVDTAALVARDADAIARAAERALAAARARPDAPRTAIVRHHVDAATRVSVTAARHPNYGAVLAVSDGRRTVRSLGTLDDATAQRFARRLTRDDGAPLAAAALAGVAGAALAALQVVPALARVAFTSVALTGTGAVVEDLAIDLNDEDA